MTRTLCGLLVALAICGCSIDHPTDALSCTATSQCMGDRSCINGFCVTSGGGGSQCPSQCSACDTTAKTCSVTGGGNNDQVSCPAGFHCDITCGANCKNVDCGDAASCTILCGGNGSCESVKCGSGRCQITCSGPNSCNSVDCRDSCGCDVLCLGSQSCSNGSRCPSQACTLGAGCSSGPPACNTCP